MNKIIARSTLRIIITAILVLLLISGAAASVNVSIAGRYNTTESPQDIAISGNYAYMTEFYGGLSVFNISNPASPVRISRSSIGRAQGVAISGNYAYVASLDLGLVVVDISNPASPSQIGSYNLGSAEDVVVSGNYAYIADHANGLVVVDISNPASSVFVGSYDTAGDALKIAINDNYAYVADLANGLVIINISNPLSPVFTGSYSGYVMDVVVKGNYAYIADWYDGLVVVNISNPATPTLAGNYDTGFARTIALSGNYTSVAESSDSITFIDVSDPTIPIPAGNYDNIGSVYGLAMLRNYTYVADHANGLVILNTVLPETNKTVLTTISVSPTSATIESGNSISLSASSFDQDSNVLPLTEKWTSSNTTVGTINSIGVFTALSVGTTTVTATLGSVSDSADVTVSNPSAENNINLRYLGRYNTAGTAHGVAVSGNYAYIADENNGVVIVDIHNPLSPTFAGSYNTGAALTRGVAILGNYAYVSNFPTLDISDPTSPLPIGNSMGSALKIVVHENYAYTATNGLTIYNLSNPTAPTLVGNYQPPNVAGGKNARAVAVSGNYAYFASNDGFEIVNISNPAAPMYAGNYNMSIPRDIVISGNYAYLTIPYEDIDGFLVVNISNPAIPTRAGSYHMENLGSISLSGDYAYTGAINTDGVFVFDVSNPTVPVLVDSIGTSGYTRDITTFGDCVYVANHDNGLVILSAKPSVLSTITVSPSSMTVVYSPTTFYASAFDQYGGTMSAAMTWSSSNTTVGTIDSSGVFTALSAGTTTIKATNGSVNGTAAVTYAPPPELEVIPVQTVYENDTLTVILNETNTIGTSLTYHINDTNNGTSVYGSISENVFTWTPDYDTVKYTDSKTFNLTITVTDSRGLSDSQVLSIKVMNTNRPPVLAQVADIITDEGSTFTIAPIASDLDDDQLTFVYTTIPSSFSGEDGSWQVTTPGSYTIDVSVVDSGGLYDNQTVAIYVLGIPPKLVIVNPVNNVQLTESALTVSGVVYDENIRSLTVLNGDISINLTQNITDFDTGGGWFEQIITLQEGTNDLVFNASDMGSSTLVTRTVVLNTAGQNLNPTLTIYSPLNDTQLSSETDEIVVRGHVSDDSGAPEVVVSINGINKIIGVSKDGFFATSVKLTEGINTIAVTARDAYNLVDTAVLSVSYNNIQSSDNQPPNLILTYPPEGFIIGTNKSLVNGYVTDDYGIENVTVNGIEVALNDGVFSKEMILTEGDNLITVVAIDTSNNEITRTRTVTYDKPDDKNGLIKIEMIRLAVSKHSLYDSSGKVSNITAFATDLAGRPANDSEIVRFVVVTNNGITQTNVPVSNGTAILPITATKTSQTIVIIASNDTTALATTHVSIKPKINIDKTMVNKTISVGNKTANENSEIAILDGGIINIQTDPNVASELIDISESDGEVTLYIDVGSNAKLEIQIENAMQIDSRNLTGEIKEIVLNNQPITSDFTELNEMLGKVTIDVDVSINGNTIPNNLEFEISGHKSIDDVIMALGGVDSGSIDADTIKDNVANKLREVYNKNANETHVDSGVASVIHAELKGTSNNDIKDVPISMTLSTSWYNNVAGGNIDNVKMFEINDSTGEIEKILDCTMVDNGDGTITFNANANGFSLYALTSTITAPDIESIYVAPTPPSSGGSGGGGGTSGEEYENIKVKNVVRKQTVINEETSYDFTEESNAIGTIKFTALKNAGTISATIEVLKGRSALVKSDPPGQVYQNMNIWVGKSGFATLDNIVDVKVGFRVEKSWIEANGIVVSTIRLCRHNSDVWNPLPTKQSGEDDKYIYFESNTPGFSPFSITGDTEEEVSAQDSATGSMSSAVTEQSDAQSQSEGVDVVDDGEQDDKGVSTVWYVIGVLVVLLIGGGAYWMYRMKNDEGKK